MIYTKQEIAEIVTKIETKLITGDKIGFDFDRKWSSSFPPKAGIYAIFNKSKLVYIGETANLKERMKEVKRTYNHSFRRKFGRFLQKDAIIIKGKFEEALELKLNKYYLKHIEFSFLELNFGRLEIESHLIHRHHKNGLLNSLGKRNRIIQKNVTK